jgi:TldD protein
MIQKNLNSYRDLISHYTELRVQENRDLQISFVKGNLVRNVKNVGSGVSARVCKNGSWGFASNPELNSESFKSVIKTAGENALFLNSRQNKGKSLLTQEPVNIQKDFTTCKPRLGQKEIMDFVKELDSYIEKKYPELSNRSISLSCLDMEKCLITSDGTSLYSMLPRSTMGISLTMSRDGKPVEVNDGSGGLGQFEDTFSSQSALYEKIDRLYEHLVKKIEGVYAEAGRAAS